MREFLSKFPWIPQYDSMQCGLACISMICKYYGVPKSLSFLEEFCGSQTYGNNLHALSMLAKDLGFDSMAVRIEACKIESVSTPAILFWNHNHFVVLYRITTFKSKRYFYISDPAKGRYKVSAEQFFSKWCHNDKGIVLIIEPTDSLLNNSEKSSIPPNFHFKLSQYWKSLKEFNKDKNGSLIPFFKILGLLMLIAVIQLALPFLTQGIVDKGINNKDIGFIWLVLLGELMLVIGRTIADYVRSWITLKASIRISLAILRKFIDKLFKLPMRYLMSRRFGDLRQRFEDHTRVHNFLTSELVSISFAVITFLVFSIVLWYYNFILLCVILGFSIIYIVWLALFLTERRKIDYERFEAASKNNSITYQLLTSIPDIKIHNCGERRRNEWEESMEMLFNNQTKLLRLGQLQNGGATLIMELKNILLTVLSASFVIKNVITLGEMLAIQYIVGQLSVPIETIMRSLYSWQDMKMAFQRIQEIHRYENEKDYYGRNYYPTLYGDITISDLSFSYEKYAPDPTLLNLNISIPKGKITAIVGGSGSGKTTLIKILLGYFPEINSHIHVNNISFNDIDIDKWRENCGVVMQDGIIFSDTIERNIVMNDEEIDVEKFKSAVEIACLSEMIESLPLKYHTLVGRDGKSLSQGQKQRILIARAVYKNPEIIIFDEATNSLDAALEHRIVENLNSFFKDRTVIIVAHRLSTIRNADKILVLHHGQIVEEGTHDQLLKAHNYYWNLIRHQTTI